MISKETMIIIPNAENPENYQIAGIKKTAFWMFAPIRNKNGKGYSKAAIVCSNCKAEKQQESLNYCANCGALMRG